MKNLLSGEFYKLKNIPIFRKIFVVTLVMALATSVFGVGYGADNAYAQVKSVLKPNPWFYILYITMASSYISTDLYEKTVTDLIYSGYSRLKIVISKFIVLHSAFFVSYFLYMFITFIIMAVFTGTGFTQENNMLDLLYFFINSFIILLGSVMIYFMLAFVMESPAHVSIFSILLYVLHGSFMVVLVLLFPPFEYIVKFSAEFLSQSLLDSLSFNVWVSVLKTLLAVAVHFYIPFSAFKKEDL